MIWFITYCKLSSYISIVQISGKYGYISPSGYYRLEALGYWASMAYMSLQTYTKQHSKEVVCRFKLNMVFFLIATAGKKLFSCREGGAGQTW